MVAIRGSLIYEFSSKKQQQRTENIIHFYEFLNYITQSIYIYWIDILSIWVEKYKIYDTLKESSIYVRCSMKITSANKINTNYSIIISIF